jgi:hypothetical protein
MADVDGTSACRIGSANVMSVFGNAEIWQKCRCIVRAQGAARLPGQSLVMSCVRCIGFADTTPQQKKKSQWYTPSYPWDTK